VAQENGRTEIVDEALATVMRAPASYTCEDVVEISCHGGSAAVNAVLMLCLRAGARLAQPGEFTKRAFLNGRIDLTQAEAVLDVIQARTPGGLAVSQQQLKGELTQRLEQIREELMAAYVQLEALVNFPEDGLDAGQDTAGPRLEEAGQRIRSLLETALQGRVLREGVRIVICGRPNVGKSSMLNVLLRQPRAIVSPVAGTTRDTIEETAQINGIPFQIVDTAGILDPRDDIEHEAVKRSRLHLQDCDLALLVLDAGSPFTAEDREIAESLQGREMIVVINKIDLPACLDLQQEGTGGFVKTVRVSALTGEGLDELRGAVVSHCLHGRKIEAQNIFLSNVRHIDALEKCLAEVDAACRPGHDLPAECVSEHIQHAVHYLDQITGRDAGADLIDQIFSRFCIGK